NELLDALWAKMLDLGRVPLESELDNLSELIASYGSYRLALNLIRRRHDLAKLSESANQRRTELLVTFAIHHFRKATRSIILDSRLRNDTLSFFGGIRSAQRNALELIASLRQEKTLSEAVEWAVEHGLGVFIEGKGVILHRSIVGRLPPALQ